MSSKLSKNVFVVLVLVVGLAFFLAGCGSKKKASTSKLGSLAVKTAQKYLGVPYVYGGRSPKGFDCSGLVWYVYNQNGLRLPNVSWRQAQVGQKVKRSELLPGDLVFFKSGGRVNHVGIYVGQGRMIHAPGRGRKVTTVKLNDKYYRTHYALARRPVR
jgi:cell wall-associated NlpC family hydrolase